MRSKGISSLLCLFSLIILAAPSFAEEGAPSSNQIRPLPFNTKIATLSHDGTLNGKPLPKGTRVLQLTKENNGETIVLIINSTSEELAQKEPGHETRLEIATIKISDIANDPPSQSYEEKIKSLEASKFVARYSDLTINPSQFPNLSHPAFNKLDLKIIKPDSEEEYKFQIHYIFPTYTFKPSEPASCTLVSTEQSPASEIAKRDQRIAYFDSKIKTLREEQVKQILDILSQFRDENCKEKDNEKNNKKLKNKLFSKLKELENENKISRLQHETIIMGLTLHGEAGASDYWDTRLQSQGGKNVRKHLNGNTVLAHMYVVGSAVKNRKRNNFSSNSTYYSESPGSIMAVCTSESQYSPWNSGNPSLREMICPTASELEAQNIALHTAFRMLDPMQNSDIPDPTNGSVSFYSPNGMKPPGSVPTWVPSLIEVKPIKVAVTGTTSEDVTIDPWLYKFYRLPTKAEKTEMEKKKKEKKK